MRVSEGESLMCSVRTKGLKYLIKTKVVSRSNWSLTMYLVTLKPQRHHKWSRSPVNLSHLDQLQCRKLK